LKYHLKYGVLAAYARLDAPIWLF